MVERIFWQKSIESAWQRRSIVWLTGVRRCGKTTLSQSLKNTEYFDCELPSVRRQMEDPEEFLQDIKGKRIVLDEIHRLSHPAELLKIAADHHPTIRVLATGSSTLQASGRFKDTLTGRKEEIWLLPLLHGERRLFGNEMIKHRLHHGGLPPFFLSPEFREKDYQEWLDSFWAKDVLDLFHLEKKYSFTKFVEMLMYASGQIFEATRFSSPCEISRGSVSNYLKVLEATKTAIVIRPFAGGRAAEIITAPKVYGFDTGFICAFRGWDSLRQDDIGFLFEHLVLNEMLAFLPASRLFYWRDKQKHEIDFIFKSNNTVVAVECKWNADRFDAKNLMIFRRHYPHGKNWVIANNVARPYTRTIDGHKVRFMSLAHISACF